MSTKPDDGRGSNNNIKGYLIDGLQKGYGHSNDALEALRSKYEDRVALALIVVSVVWVMWFSFFFAQSSGNEMDELWMVSLLGTVMLSVVLLALLLLVRTRYFAKAREIRKWSDAFRGALDREISGRVHGMEEESSLGLLLEASLEIPQWLGIERKSVLQKHYVLSTTILILVVAGLTISYYSIPMTDPWIRMWSLCLSAAALAASALIYAWIWKFDRTEFDRKMKEWRAFIDNSRLEIESMLGKL